MAGEIVQMVLNDKPQDALLGLGGGDLLKGIAVAGNRVSKMKKCWHDLMLLYSEYTVGVAATFNIIFKMWNPFMWTGMIYSNSATATGKITAIKYDGELILPRGMTSTGATNPLASTLCLIDTGQFQVYVPGGGNELSIEGTATNADVVGIYLWGYDLDFASVG